jgi:SWI/SNF-related matrix-associated actin-dependent regulator 1 of chromatin subfamily A
MKELPPKAKYTIETDLSTAKAKEYRAMESDTIVWLAEEGRNSEYADALAKIMILKRLAGEGKIDAAMEWIDTFLDSTSRKLVVFAHHKAVVNALADKYGGMRVAGADSMKARQEVIDKFQSDDDARVIVLNMKAGGVGITLTAASDVLFVEQGWTPAEHDQATDRCHRIGQDASVVSSWYLLADGTIDDDIFELIEAKRIVVDAVTDGEDDLAVSVMNGLIDKLVKRAND